MHTRFVFYFLIANFVIIHGFEVNNIENVIRKAFECRNNPGMAVSVVRKGQIVMAKGFGVKDIESNETVTNKTLFGIASLSKAFAATILLKVLENHNLRYFVYASRKDLEKMKSIKFNTRLSDIFDNDNIFADDLRSRYTTIEDLLGHRVGLPSNNRLRFDTNLTRANLVKRLRYLKGHGEFRDSFYYNNLLYGLLTYLAEKTGGDSWENLVREKIFKPLGMTSSDFTTTADPTTLDLAQGYYDVYGELIPVPFEVSRRWGQLCGSGCVLSDAVDMAKWMMFHLERGKNENGAQVVDKDVVDRMHKVTNHITSKGITKYTTRPDVPVARSQENYAMGWRTGFYRGFDMLTHTGSTYGYRAMLALFPAMDVGIFIALTGDDPGYVFRTALQMYIADMVLGESPWLNASTICSFPEPWNEASKPKSKPSINKNRSTVRNPSAYVGTYSNSAYGSIIVTKRGDNGLSINYGWAEFKLYPKSTNDSFYGETQGISAYILGLSTFDFHYDQSKNKVTRVTVPSFESKTPPMFVKQESSAKHSHGPANGGIMAFPCYLLCVICILCTASPNLLGI